MVEQVLHVRMRACTHTHLSLLWGYCTSLEGFAGLVKMVFQ